MTNENDKNGVTEEIKAPKKSGKFQKGHKLSVGHGRPKKPKKPIIDVVEDIQNAKNISLEDKLKMLSLIIEDKNGKKMDRIRATEVHTKLSGDSKDNTVDCHIVVYLVPPHVNSLDKLIEHTKILEETFNKKEVNETPTTV